MESKDHTALFATANGFIAINGEVKLQILEFLQADPKSFDEIVRSTGKAKSTVSVHLNDLQKANLVREQVDPSDRRRKTYTLCSKYIACSREPLDFHYYQTLDMFTSSLKDEFDFLKYAFRAVRYGSEAQGINNGPLMKIIGRDIGGHISATFDFDDVSDVFEELRGYWRLHKLGKMYIDDVDPLTIRVKDCFECDSIPVVGHPVCSFDEGVLEGIFSSSIGLNLPFIEKECYAAGDNHCLFITE
ncbi:putative hydrocarbon binding protein [Methanohalophilus levihalophilus]|uniref:V4R domain-containing protein n=1 Tax=Methanohalophilus levihalophilus TaxID=1431282 RepID=UPI001AE4A336|nr:V4R domain-containing protein [Methanohalophilus levihalophilus]MBP2029677.1 putative hydrocarbon binding protein [Methanohalophilus levihalophilus]